MNAPQTFTLLTRRAAMERLSKPAKPVKTGRVTNLACYAPLGEQAAVRRILGGHLAPDGPDMEACSAVFASSLLNALTTKEPGTRILIGPARYSDRILQRYCSMLAKTAFGEPGQDLISPALVPYLLGGITTKAVEELAHRALEVMDFFPDPLTKFTLARALNGVGFGAQLPHDHYDERCDANYVEPPKKYNHLSFRQEYLLNLPRTGSYAHILITKGAYDSSLRRTITGMKLEVMEETRRLLDPGAGEMTELAARQRRPVQVTDASFIRAVHRVFRKPWMELDLSGLQENALIDIEILMARLIIHRLTYKTLKSDKMSAETLVGISLLTGVSLANWTEFAVYDLRRRGDTFITPEAIEQAIHIVEVSPHFTCEQQLRGAATEIRYQGAEKQRWARRLQSPTRPLWSSNGRFYVNGIDANGLPTYVHKPFSLSTD